VKFGPVGKSLQNPFDKYPQRDAPSWTVLNWTERNSTELSWKDTDTDTETETLIWQVIQKAYAI